MDGIIVDAVAVAVAVAAVVDDIGSIGDDGIGIWIANVPNPNRAEISKSN